MISLRTEINSVVIVPTSRAPPLSVIWRNGETILIPPGIASAVKACIA